MNKVYFQRNTHDEQGNFRGESYFGQVDMVEERKKAEELGIDLTDDDYNKLDIKERRYKSRELFFGVHTFDDSNELLTLDEVHQRTIDMLKGGAYDGPWKKEIERLTPEATLRKLSFMVSKGLVKIVMVDKYIPKWKRVWPYKKKKI